MSFDELTKAIQALPGILSELQALRREVEELRRAGSREPESTGWKAASKFAEEISVSQKTIRNWVEQGHLEAQKVGGTWLVRFKD